jgi:sugar phosphate isomerase/epimerase
MILMGIGDEAGSALDTQLHATRALGWQHVELRAVEVPGHAKACIHEITDDAFAVAAEELSRQGVRAYCFGSTIMNWAKRIESPFAETIAEVKRTIPRMERLGTRFVRIMSFKPGDEESRIPAQVFDRVREVTNRFLDAGLQPVHENCMNHGGMSWKHALELLDKAPGLKWAFDAANPVFNPDRSKPKPWPRQDAWEFWENIREHVAHIHIKDAVWNPTRQDADYCWPGEGQGCVREILADALRHGYAGGVSMEPHMVVVFHGDNAGAPDNQVRLRENFLEYGRRLKALVSEARGALMGSTGAANRPPQPPRG